MPVRDPLAGILSDWFGIPDASARALVLLYRATVPLTREDLATKLKCPPGQVRNHIDRARSSLRSSQGPPALKPIQRRRRPNGHWDRGTYELTAFGRDEIIKALRHTSDRIASVCPALPQVDRIATLEAALGITPERQEPGLTRFESRLYGLLAKAGVLHRERAMLVLYGHLDDPPLPKTLDVHITHMRRKLASRGEQIHAVFGVGWRLEKARELRVA